MRLDFTISNNEIDKSSRSLLVFLAILAFLIFSFTVVKNTISKTKTLYKNINENQAKVKALKNKLAVLGSLDKNTLSWQLQTVESVFPSDKPILNLINSLKNTAVLNKVSFGGVTLNPGTIKEENKKALSQDTGKLQTINLGITVNGTLADIFNFVDSLKQTAPLTSVNSLAISSLGKEEGSLTRAAINLTIYYQGAPVDLGKADSQIKTLTETQQAMLDELKGYTVFPESKPRESIAPKDNFFTP